MAASPVLTLLHVGRVLPPSVRDQIIALGDAAVAPLIALLDVEYVIADGPGRGYAAAHAVTLLGELRAVAAVDPLIDLLADSDPMDLLFSPLIFALIAIGQPAVEPCLAAYETADDTMKTALAESLAGMGVRDERILKLLLGELARDPESAAGAFVAYRDRRALPHLLRQFDRLAIDEHGGRFANQVFIEIEDAVSQLGGALVGERWERFTAAMAVRDRALAARSSGGRLAGPDHLGRNGPCRCGSGRKYKRCHLADDEDAGR